MNKLGKHAQCGSASSSRFGWIWIAVGGASIGLILGVLFHHSPPGSPVVQETQSSTNSTSSKARQIVNGSPSFTSGPAAVLTADQIVADKLSSFGQNRREVMRRMADHFKVEVPPDAERFFDAIQTAPWEQVQTLFGTLKDQTTNSGAGSAIRQLWAPIQETFGVAEQTHQWPARKLLDYGDAILGSLRPGMIYVGGTDSGRFIPTLLNETGAGEHHVILTQNALADNSYLEYVRFLYADRLQVPGQADSQAAFQAYLTDAQKRLGHDQQFQNEPPQLRPGEDVRVTGNRVQVSGQVAVMAINERLLNAFMEKNPDASFAIEQSFPFESTYATASLLGPLMELRVDAGQNGLTPERAAASAEYWRTTTQQLLSDSEAASSPAAMKAWSKLLDDQAALLLSRKYLAEAEEGFRLATQLCPSSPETIFRYVNLLLEQNRIEDARAVAALGAKAAPDEIQFQNLVNTLSGLKPK